MFKTSFLLVKLAILKAHKLFSGMPRDFPGAMLDLQDWYQTFDP